MKAHEVRGMVVVLCGAILCVGCTVAPVSVDKSAESSPASARGAVIVSVTQTSDIGWYGYFGELEYKCESGAKGKVADGPVYLDGAPAPTTGKTVIAKGRPLGKVHVLELPAGACEFVRYRAVTANTFQFITNNREPWHIHFEVAAGKTTYIGAFNTAWGPPPPRSAIASWIPSVDDFFERDIAAIRKQDPALLPVLPDRQMAHGL